MIGALFQWVSGTYHRNFRVVHDRDRIRLQRSRCSPSSRWRRSCSYHDYVVVVEEAQVSRCLGCEQNLIRIIKTDCNIELFLVSYQCCDDPWSHGSHSDRRAVHMGHRTEIRTDLPRARSWRDRRIRVRGQSTGCRPESWRECSDAMCERERESVG